MMLSRRRGGRARGGEREVTVFLVVQKVVNVSVPAHALEDEGPVREFVG